MAVVILESIDMVKLVAMSHLLIEGVITANEFCRESEGDLDPKFAYEFCRLVNESKKIVMHRIGAGRN